MRIVQSHPTGWCFFVGFFLFCSCRHRMNSRLRSCVVRGVLGNVFRFAIGEMAVVETAKGNSRRFCAVKTAVVSSSLTGAATKNTTHRVVFFCGFSFCSNLQHHSWPSCSHRLSVAKSVVAVCERRRWRMQRAKRLVPRSKCGDANSERTHFGHRKRKHDGWTRGVC